MNNTRKANRKANLASGAAAGAPATRNANRRNNMGVSLLKIPDEYNYKEGIHIISARPIYTQTNKGANYKNPAKAGYSDNVNYVTNVLTNENKARLESTVPLLYDMPFLRWITEGPQVDILKTYCGTPGLQLYYERNIRKILKRNYFFEISVTREGYIEGFSILNHGTYNIIKDSKFLRVGRNMDILEICTGIKRGGIGKHLVETSIQFARAFGCDKMTVEAVPNAIDFYLKLGFLDNFKESMEKSLPHLIPYPACKITRDGMIIADFLKEYRPIYDKYRTERPITKETKSQMIEVCKTLYERLYGKTNNKNNGNNEYGPPTDNDILRTCLEKLREYRGEPSNCLLYMPL
jgi:GNAT superfamily N-acetyltransferase